MTNEEKEEFISKIAGYNSTFLRLSINDINSYADTKEEADELYNIFESTLIFTLISHYFMNEKNEIDTEKTTKCISKFYFYFRNLIMDIE